MGLVFKQFKLAVPYCFRNEEPLPLVAICGTIIAATHSSKVKFMKRLSKQPQYTYSLY